MNIKKDCHMRTLAGHVEVSLLGACMAIFGDLMVFVSELITKPIEVNTLVVTFMLLAGFWSTVHALVAHHSIAYKKCLDRAVKVRKREMAVRVRGLKKHGKLP